MKIEMQILDPRIDTDELRPKYATAGSCALDLRACRLETKPMTAKINLYPGGKVKVGAGFSIHMQPIDEPADVELRFGALLLPRSGLGSRGIVLSNVVGLIDADYQGEVIMAIENRGSEVFVIEPLSRLAQMAITPVVCPKFAIVQEFTETTARGAGGFGHTGN